MSDWIPKTAEAIANGIVELDEHKDNPEMIAAIDGIIRRHYDQASRCPDCQTRGSVSRTKYVVCNRCRGKGRVVPHG